MKYTSKTRVVFLSLIVVALFFVQPVAGQVKMRVIPFPESSSSNDEEEKIPLELVEIKIAGRPVILGQSFDADENWLKDMTLRVKNVSNKPIIAFGLGGGLLKGVDEELPSYASFRDAIGWGWGDRFDPEKEKPKGVALKPGETVELSYVNVHHLTRKDLAKEGEGAFCKLEFRAPNIQYEDGTVDSMAAMRFSGNIKP